ncbi:MAG: OmpP1/FadL family transporter [Solirubrobacteraceae bacterium]
MKIKNQLLSALCILSGSLFAQGYQVPLQGVKEASLGGVSAFADDASIGYFNPAGLAFVEGKGSISAGAFGVLPQTKFTSAAGVVSKNKEGIEDVVTPFYLAASYKPTDKIAVGLNIATPFGSVLNYNSAGSQFNNTYSNLQVFSVQPSLAVKLNNWISVGGAAVYYTGNLTQRAQFAPSSPGFIQLKSDFTAINDWGWNVGVFLKPAEGLNISAAYRSYVDAQINGSDFTSNTPLAIITSVNTNLPLPAQYSFSVAYQMLPKLLFAGEINLVEWSKLDKITISNAANNTALPLPLTKNWSDTVIYRVGLEYSATDKIALRAGYNQSPAVMQSAAIATSSDLQYLTDRHTVTGGLGYKASEKLNVNLYGAYLIPGERTITSNPAIGNGTASISLFAAGLGIAYSIK